MKITTLPQNYHKNYHTSDTVFYRVSIKCGNCGNIYCVNIFFYRTLSDKLFREISARYTIGGIVSFSLPHHLSLSTSQKKRGNGIFAQNEGYFSFWSRYFSELFDVVIGWRRPS